MEKCEFSFLCNKRWVDLMPLNALDVKFCDVCNKNIYRIHDRDEFLNRARNNECVAIFAEILKKDQNKKNDVDYFVVHSEILNKLSDILITVENFQIDTWRLVFIEKLNRVFDLQTAIYDELLDDVIQYLTKNDLDQIIEILQNAGISFNTLYHDENVEDLMGIPAWISDGNDVIDPILMRPISDLDLKLELVDRLNSVDIYTIRDILICSKHYLISGFNINQLDISIIEEALASRGLTFGMKII
jgi:hypothetical protein